MNFRFIDRYDHEIVPINNAPTNGGNGYGDVFPDRDLLASSQFDFLGGTGDFHLGRPSSEGGYRLEFLEVTQGEAAGRSNFQKVALYHGSKASRKILGAPLPSWPSWSAVAQPPPQTVVIHARQAPAEQQQAKYFRQAIPPTITATLCDTGSDLVYAGSWLNHHDTRHDDNVHSTLTTSGYIWLNIASHFSPIIVRDEQTQQLRHDWKNSAIFYITVVLFHKESAVWPDSLSYGTRELQAGVRFAHFPIRAINVLPITLPLPPTGIYSQDAIEDSSVAFEWTDIAYVSNLVKDYSTQEVSQTYWLRKPLLYWFSPQSFYIAPN